MNMMSLFNSQERDEAEWREVIEKSGFCLQLEHVEHPAGSNYSIMWVALIEN